MLDVPEFVSIERADPLVDSVLQRMTQAIITGRLKPGDKLVETRLGDMLGVSRGPVREAFRRLEQMGLVDKIPYRGAFVSTLTQRDIDELHSLRGPLEGMAARLLAEGRDPQALARLEDLLQGMRRAAGRGDQGAIIALDADFHDALITLSDHKLLGEVWAPVSVRLRRFLLLKRQRLYRTLADAALLHEPIVAAIAQGDAEQAEAEARRHIAAAGQYTGDWNGAEGLEPAEAVA